MDAADRSSVDARARAWRDGAHARICDSVEPWEITQVFVHPGHRGGGRGTAMTRAAIIASRDAEDLWIVADDDDRPKQLYARLGFAPAWTTMEFLRLPDPQASAGAPGGS